MSSDEEISTPKTIDKPAGKSQLLYGRDQLRAILEALGQLHLDGNPLVLHEVIRRSQEHDLPLPKWAATALMQQEVALLNDKKHGKMGRYEQSLKPWVRQKTYSSIMAWLKDERRYSGMPRSVIERWYNGEILHRDEKSNLTKSRRALDLSVEALAGTFASTSQSQLKETVYKDPLKIQLSALISNFDGNSNPNDSEPDDLDDPKYIESVFREKLGEKWVYDEWEVEAKVGLLSDFFGPPGPPPPNIQAELDKLDNAQLDGGVFSEK